MKIKNVKIPGSFVLIFAFLFSNFLNFLFNAILGRSLTFEQFGAITLMNTLWYLASIVFSALSATVNYKTSFHSGKGEKLIGDAFYKYLRKTGITYSTVVAFILVLVSPLIAAFFNVSDWVALSSLFVIISFEIFNTTTRGYLQGNLYLIALAALVTLESISKLLLALLFIALGLKAFVFLTIPLSIAITFIGMILFAPRYLSKPKEALVVPKLPRKYFLSSLLTGLSSASFLSIDVLLAKHYLSPRDAGVYALLSLTGKIIYFLASIFNGFITTYTARNLGSNKNPSGTFYKIVFCTLFFTTGAFIALGPLGEFTTQLLFGNKAVEIFPYLAKYCAAILLFSITMAIVVYHLAHERFIFSVLSLLSAVFIIVGLIGMHDSIYEITNVVFYASVSTIIAAVYLHFLYSYNPSKKPSSGSFLTEILPFNTKNRPKVSVCLPAYNEGKNMRALLDSLLKQETKYIKLNKIVVVSSASTDDTEEIVKEYMKKDRRVELICQDERKGKASAINKFLKSTKDPFVVIESADTIPDKHTIEALCLPFLMDEKIGMTGGAPFPVNDPNTCLGYIIHSWWWFHRKIPRFGEIIAFRNIFGEISPTTAVDEAYIQAQFVKLGYSIVPVDHAIVYNKGAENFKDLVKQRRRVFNGHVRLEEEEGVRVSNMTSSSLKLLLFKYPIYNFKQLTWLIVGISIEIYARILGLYDKHFKEENPTVWEIASSTKDLKIEMEGGINS